MVLSSLPHRMPQLDGLRGIAIVAVMLFHAGLLPGGFIGVDVFFVLSGYLITTILMDEWRLTRGVRLSHFYLRRAVRLLPALFATVAVAVPYALTRLPERSAALTLQDAPLTLLYIFNWSVTFGGDRIPSYISHTWSLNVEEQFYLLWAPALALLLARGWSVRRLILLTVVLALGSELLRAVLWDLGFSRTRIAFNTVTRGDGLLVGCAAALLPRAKSISSIRLQNRLLAGFSLIFLGAASVGFQGDGDPALYQGGFVLLAVASAILILHLVGDASSPLSSVLAWAPLAALGQISYGLYLWHWLAYNMVWNALGHAPLLIPLQFALAFLVAGLSWRYLERPFLQLKGRWAPISQSRDSHCERPVTPLRPGSLSTTAANPEAG